MKIILTILFLGLANLYAQTSLPTAKDGMVTYDGIVELKGMPKGLLYANAKYWFDTYYKSPRVIQSEDSMEGVIHHFKLFTEGFAILENKAYFSLEAPKGEFGYF